MTEEQVTSRREDGVTTVTINRENRRNALSGAVIQELKTLFQELSDDPETRTIVLTGAGTSIFCAGGDIADFQGGDGMLDLHWSRGEFADLMLTMARCSKPVIAKINGHALGGGFGLMLACDIVVSVSAAKMGTPEIKLGLFPMMIMAIIVRNLGRKHALELMLTGDRISAQRGVEIGAVNHVVETHEELEQKTEEIARKIGGFSPATLRLGRNAFYETQDMDFEQSLRALNKDLTLTVMSEDAAEGVTAFFEKRKPVWKGR